MKNVVAYARVSSASQLDNTSIDTQIEKIKLHCQLYDYNLVKIFKDEAKSAKDEKNRPEYQNMMNYISDTENNINAIIVFKNDRLHRSLYNLLSMIYDLQDKKIDIISVTEQFDTGTAQGMLFIQMLGSFSEFERKLINERTKSGRLSKGKSDLYAGGRVPFGYNLVNSNTLTINYEEAKTVKEIFKLRNKSLSLSRIGQRVNMRKQKVDYIIKNPIYKGVYKYDGSVEQNKISFQVPHIVSKYTWDKANCTQKKK